MSIPGLPVDQPVAGRDCGTCTLCCKVYDVPVLDKPLGQWCPHCKPGKGCGIHETRPEFCRQFNCLWILAEFLGPEWKPERSRFVLSVDPATRSLFAQVDPAQPTVWKKPPYHTQFRQWAAAGVEVGRLVVIFVNRAATVVLPDKDVELGIINPGEKVFLTRSPRMGGTWIYNAHKGPAAPKG